uniref:Uncharacterized protein n=1 Tax=Arundo donax TaxID=35708 RepID=A0A0A8YNU2_ARUDO
MCSSPCNHVCITKKTTLLKVVGWQVVSSVLPSNVFNGTSPYNSSYFK